MLTRTEFFIDQRERFIKRWPIISTVFLFFLLSYIWTIKKSVIINIFTLVLNSSILNLISNSVCIIGFILLLIGSVLFLNEKRYIKIIQKLNYDIMENTNKFKNLEKEIKDQIICTDTIECFLVEWNIKDYDWSSEPEIEPDGGSLHSTFNEAVEFIENKLGARHKFFDNISYPSKPIPCICTRCIKSRFDLKLDENGLYELFEKNTIAKR